MAAVKSGKSKAKSPSSKSNKTLVIVESPSKAKTIGKYLGSRYNVIASVGHVRDLPKSKLGIDIDDNFEPQYISIEERVTSSKVSRKRLLRRARFILQLTLIEREKLYLGI